MKASVCAFVVALACLLGGCDGSTATPEPKDTFTPSESSDSPTATESTDAGPTEPVLPDVAKEATKAGAEAFVRYYWDVVNYAQHSGDIQTLRRINFPSCAPCNAGWKWISKIYGRGGRIIGGELTINDLEIVPSGGGWVASVSLTTTRQSVRGAGDLNSNYGTKGSDVVMTVRHSRALWQATSMDVQ